MKTLRYLREKKISLLEALVLGFLAENPGGSQNDFRKKEGMSRNQVSQLFNKCLLKGWIYDEAVLRRPKATDSFKFYTLTKSGEAHAEVIAPQND